jgi:hypothetical protein
LKRVNVQEHMIISDIKALINYHVK